MMEGAVGGAETQYPKPQRQTKKHQAQGDSRQMMPNHQGNNQPQQNNYYQDPHNTTTYMELPSSIRSKICGKCGLIGHIKRFCKEEVYCKYCKVYTHSTTACRTYPATSSRKNTPEKRTQEDIDQEVNRRVQKDLLRILTGLSTNRQIAIGGQETMYPNQSSTQTGIPTQTLNKNAPYQHIPERRQEVQNLIGDFQRPLEVTDQEHGTVNSAGQTRENNNQDPILNQQWDEQLQLQPPLRPTNVSTSQHTSNTTNRPKLNMARETKVENSATRRQVEVTVDKDQDQQSNTEGATDIQPNVTRSATNRRVEQPSCTQCNCHCQQSGEARNTILLPSENQRLNVHTEYEDKTNGASKFFPWEKTD